jgi:hypothetical protein
MWSVACKNSALKIKEKKEWRERRKREKWKKWKFMERVRADEGCMRRRRKG